MIGGGSPRGVPGPGGPQGVAGPAGPAGAPGPAGSGTAYTPAVTTKFADYQILVSDNILHGDATGLGNINFTLPLISAAFTAGLSILVTVTNSSTDASTVTVLAKVGDSFFRISSAVINPGDNVTFYTDGVKWYVQ